MSGVQGVLMITHSPKIEIGKMAMFQSGPPGSPLAFGAIVVKVYWELLQDEGASPRIIPKTIWIKNPFLPHELLPISAKYLMKLEKES
jgi:hypothetical protein